MSKNKGFYQAQKLSA